MCGICGILRTDGDRRERDRRVAAMTAALVHRGPDDHGAWADESVALGFRRLAVIDLHTGQQPIRLENDAAVIVLNGEIYNFRELRRELEPRHAFRSRGDVEVVLRLYAEHGIACLRRLNGMFALAIWDKPERTLYLARDRFGIKPLYVCREDGQLAFASEVRALLAGDVPSRPRVDRVQLHHFLHQKYIAPRGSILEGVRALPPGSVLEVGPGGEREYAFWSPPAAPPPGDEREWEEELARRLDAAAARQLVADVPVGVFLSGGLDSSTLTALVRRHAGRVGSYSVGFEGEGAVSELPEARTMARRLDTDHHEIVMDPARVASDLDDLLGDLDEPLGDATCIPTWYLCRLARSGVVVALSGEGADEMFGGYPRQRWDAWLDRIGPAGRSSVPALLRLAGRRPSERLRRRLRMASGLVRQLDWSRVFTAETLEALVAAPLPDEDAVVALHGDLDDRWVEMAGADPVNARLEVDRRAFLPGDLLPKVDRMSMAHSLEVRVPYLDDEVAELVLPLPGRVKAGLRGKRLLRRVAAGILPGGPPAVPKRGFDVPVAAWLRGPLRAALTDFLSPESVRRRGWFRPEAVTTLVDEHLSRRADHGERLWLLVVLEAWTRRVLERSREVVG